jgi:hypothetical protein
MHELVDLGHSMMRAVIGLCQDETRTSKHVGISPAEEGWTVANDNEMYLVAALTCNVLQQGYSTKHHRVGGDHVRRGCQGQARSRPPRQHLQWKQSTRGYGAAAQERMSLRKALGEMT